jgi:hypothetical protein
MTVLEALAILEAAVLECKKRNINTPEVKDALDLLEPHIQPTWLIPQFRHLPFRCADLLDGLSTSSHGLSTSSRPKFIPFVSLTSLVQYNDKRLEPE